MTPWKITNKRWGQKSASENKVPKKIELFGSNF
jgi:hypothetical protein